MDEYKGGTANNIDIIETLKKKELVPTNYQINQEDDCNINIFHPSPEKWYSEKDLITLNTDSGLRTMKVSKWLTEDPVSFDITRRKQSLKVSKDVFELLISKLKANYPQYFRDVLGLKTRIEFKGYDTPVQAMVPFSAQPVEFYKWWIENPDRVKLSLKEKIQLFDKVFMESPTTLKREHKKIINKQ